MQQQKKQVFVGPYILGETVGVGSTGKVKVGYHQHSGKEVAVKIVKKSLLADNIDARQRVEREIKVLKLLLHPNVVRLHDVMQTPTHLFAVTEFLSGGELYEHITHLDAPLAVPDVFRYFHQLISAVSYMHSQGICHRDLKLENILLDRHGHLKLADFGMASAMPRDLYLETSCGSPHYACPEIINGERYLGTAADTWSCGVLLYAMATSSLPFDCPNIDVLFSKIRQGKYFMPPDLPANLRDLIARMLKVNGKERITIDEIQQHPFWIEHLVYLNQPQ
ncbi:hypothetical protein DIPPA_33595 [Diplonema papillatum]|nr:hypothetical protein DIPPA_33595 [Diplonema papillatum]